MILKRLAGFNFAVVKYKALEIQVMRFQYVYLAI